MLPEACRVLFEIRSGFSREGKCKMEQDVLQELVNGILSVMEEKLVRIVLYGSVARGTSTKESDVDIALIMHGILDHKTEDALSEIIVEMNLKYDRVFSVIDIDAAKFERWEQIVPFYQSVSREGIVLWKAA